MVALDRSLEWLAVERSLLSTDNQHPLRLEAHDLDATLDKDDQIACSLSLCLWVRKILQGPFVGFGPLFAPAIKARQDSADADT